MSLILDALNRSDSERANPDAAPGLQSVHGAFPQPPAPLWRRALWPGLVLVLSIVAVLPWVGDRDSAPEQTAHSAAPQPRRLAEAVEPPAPAPPAAPAGRPGAANRANAANEAPEEAVNVDVAALYQSRQNVESLQSSQAARDRISELPAAAEPALSSDAGRTASGAPSTEAKADERPVADVNALARAAEAALADRRGNAAPLVEHEAPFVVDLSQPVKDQIPSIFYSAHKWASDPAQRSVVLNGQERRAGQQVKPGLRLVEILEDSIVLDFRGTEFRLRSLNSWVNL
jgi:hypothetical protein